MSIITININADLGELLSVSRESFSLLQQIGLNVMATQTDVDALTAQVQKVFTEVQTAADSLRVQIAALQAIIDAGQVVLDLTGLQAALQTLDDLNPDLPVV